MLLKILKNDLSLMLGFRDEKIPYPCAQPDIFTIESSGISELPCVSHRYFLPRCRLSRD